MIPGTNRGFGMLQAVSTRDQESLSSLRYKCVPVCEAGCWRKFRSLSAAFAAALFGAGVDFGLTEFRRAFVGGFGGRL